MNTKPKRGSPSLASRTTKNQKAPADTIILKQLRYDELDTEFLRENRRLKRLVRQLKEGLNKKVF